MKPDVIITGSAVFDGKNPAQNLRKMLEAVGRRVPSEPQHLPRRWNCCERTFNELGTCGRPEAAGKRQRRPAGRLAEPSSVEDDPYCRVVLKWASADSPAGDRRVLLQTGSRLAGLAGR